MPGLSCSNHLLESRMCLCSFQALSYDLSKHAVQRNDIATEQIEMILDLDNEQISGK